MKTEWTNAILNLYGNDNKGKNIINSVNDAFQDGLNKPIFYKSIDNIIQDEQAI